MMSLWDALRMNMMISYQELVRTFLRKLINMRKNNGYNYLTEIDGSCNEKTFGQIAESGVDVFIVGTSGLFSLHEDVSQAWDRMIEIFQRETVAA